MKRHRYKKNGFSLIELLIVIVIIAIFAIGLIAAINPLDKINSAADARVMNDISLVGRATESYAVSHLGAYPAAMTDLPPNELKNIPIPPSGYSYTFTALPAACIAGSTCTSLTITAPLKSKKFTATPFERYESTGKTCQVATAATACP
ncbi:MAG TPA: prepilin-type N-terminal cleavage/methylation domain-containing protein [Candidatus Saccharimonadales bacterium]|nr:prepilin-type N-terminal cleavage/methylation domain-containing protein [Candidatus Saccharimonadales bacterium]